MLLAGPENQLILRVSDIDQLYKGHTGSILQAHFLPDNRHAISLGDDRTVRVWDLASKQQRMWIPTDENPIDLACSPNGDQVLIVASGGDAVIRNIKTGGLLTTLPSSGQHNDRGLAFSPDGEYVIDYGGEIQRIWHLNTDASPEDSSIEWLEKPEPAGRALQTAPLRSGFMSANGRFALALTDIRTVAAFDPVTGDILQDIPREIGLNHSIFGGYVPHPTQNQVFYRNNARNEFVLWDLDERRRKAQFTIPPGGEQRWVAIYISPNGRYLSATLVNRRQTMVLDTEKGVWGPLLDHRIGGQVQATAPPRPSPVDGSLLFSDVDATIRLLRPDGSVKEFVGSQAKVTAAEFLPDGKRFISGDTSGEVRIWDLQSGKTLRSVPTGGSVSMISVPSVSERPVLVSSGGRVRGYDPDSGEVRYTLAGDPGNTRGKLSGDGSRAIVYGPNSSRVWNLGRSSANSPQNPAKVPIPSDDKVLVKQVKSFTGRSGIPEAVDLSPDESTILVAIRKSRNEAEVYLMDAQTGKPLPEPRFDLAISFNLSLVKFDASGRRILLPLPNSEGVRIWDLDEQEGHDYRFPQAPAPASTSLRDAAISPDGKYLLMAGDYQQSYLIDLKTRKVVYTSVGSSSGANRVAFLPDGSRFAISGGWLVETDTLEPLHAIGDLVALLPDGRRYVSHRRILGEICVRDPEGPDLRFSDPVAKQSVRGKVKVTPDGRMVVVTDQALWVGDTNTGRILGRTVLPPYRVNFIEALTLSADGQRIVTASYSGTVKIWQITSEKNGIQTPSKP